MPTAHDTYTKQLISSTPNLSKTISLLEAIFGDSRKVRQASNSQLSEHQAQILLDSFEWLSNAPVLDEYIQLPLQLVFVMQNLSAISGLFPTSYILAEDDVEGYHDTNPIPGRGTNFDIYRGRFQGKVVCIKSPRPTSKEQEDAVTKEMARAIILYRQLAHANLTEFVGVLHGFHNKIALVTQWMENDEIMTYLKRNPEANRLFLDRVLVDETGRARISFSIFSAFETNVYTVDPVFLTKSAHGQNLSNEPTGESIKSVLVPYIGRFRWTKKSDIYTLAILFHEPLLTLAKKIYVGVRPFAELSPDTVKERISNGERAERPSPSSISWTTWGLTEPIWVLITDCWDQKPALRPTSNEVARRLQLAALATTVDDRPRYGRKFPRHRLMMNKDAIDFEAVNGVLSEVAGGLKEFDAEAASGGPVHQ
ncbi:hypothetical protein H0H93_009288 [Arthromyces matolae]|nr:hypothetical protein H0H93_009288 [Arthromyces matolae]